MSRFAQDAVLLAGAVCILALVASAQNGRPTYTATGQVFCDPCRLSMLTSFSTPLAGATVRLECRRMSNNATTYIYTGFTDDRGVYTLIGQPRNQDDICQVVLQHSRNFLCNETIANGFTQEYIDDNPDSDIRPYTGPRFGNPLSFTQTVANESCPRS